MPPLIEYRAQAYPTLHIAVDPGSDFPAIVEDFESLRFPPVGIHDGIIAFALLELVANSVRAHREHGVESAVSVFLAAGDGRVSVRVLDEGRGFDPGVLPYRLGAPLRTIDVLGDSFTAYRQRSGGSRSGLGIYSALKVFPVFSLGFVDREGRACAWYCGRVRGTRIDLALPLLEGGGGAGGPGRSEALVDAVGPGC